MDTIPWYFSADQLYEMSQTLLSWPHSVLTFDGEDGIRRGIAVSNPTLSTTRRTLSVFLGEYPVVTMRPNGKQLLVMDGAGERFRCRGVTVSCQN